MEITKPDQLTGPVIREIRLAAGKTLSEFWGPFGVNKSQASVYERREQINQAFQQLIYLSYVCGVPVDLPHDAMVAVGKIAGGIGQGIAAIDDAINNLNSAKAHILEA